MEKLKAKVWLDGLMVRCNKIWLTIYRYEGEFKMGKREGVGKLTWPEGEM